MTEETTGDPREIKQEEIEKPIALFHSKMATIIEHIGDTEFHLAALPTTVQQWITSKHTRTNSFGLQEIDTSGILVDTARFGISNIVNLIDEDNEEIEPKWDSIKIAGRGRKMLSNKIIDGINTSVLTYLSSIITNIGTIKQEELDRLDFFTRSEGGGSSASDTSDQTEA